MTSAERRDTSNGIWLCQTHSRLIDSDEGRYSSQTLRQWKELAESRARAEIGTRLPSEHDAHDQLVMALTRTPTSFLPTAIQNVHGATAELLNSLDSRIRVETSFVNNRTTFTFLPQEPIPVNFVVGERSASQWRSQIRALVEHGETADLPGGDVQVLGSLVFDKAFTPEVLENGRFVFTAAGRPAVAKVSLVDPNSQASFTVDDFRGRLTHGTQSFSFTGTSCADLLSLTLRFPRNVTVQSDGDFTIALKFEQWEAKPVLGLPYFDRLRDFYANINDGWVVSIELEIDGTRILGAHMRVPQDSNAFRSSHVMLQYTNRVRRLVSKLGAKVDFHLQTTFSAEDHMHLAEIVDILMGEDPLTEEGVEQMSCNLIADAGGQNILQLRDKSVSHQLVMRNDSLQPLELFGTTVALPPLITTMENVIPLIDASGDDFKEGDAVPIVWSPANGFKFSRSFDLGGEGSIVWPS